MKKTNKVQITREVLVKTYPTLIAHLLGLGEVYLNPSFVLMETEQLQYGQQEIDKITVTVHDCIAQLDLDLAREAGFSVDSIWSSSDNREDEAKIILTLSLPQEQTVA